MRALLFVLATCALVAGCAPRERPPATSVPSAATSAVTAAPPPTMTPAPSTPTPTPTPDVSQPFPGFEQTCVAKLTSWAELRTKRVNLLACLDQAVVNGGAITLRGWASGAFEGNVQLSLRRLDGTELAHSFTNIKEVGFGYDENHLPGWFGPFEKTFPFNAPPGPAVAVAYLPSGRDGSELVSGRLQIVLP